MSRIDAEAQCSGFLRRSGKRFQRLITGPLRESKCVGFGIQLDAVSARLSCGTHARQIGINKHADPRAKRLQPSDQRLYRSHFGPRREAAIGSWHIERVGNQRDLLRLQVTEALYNLHQVVVRIAFDIELAICVLSDQCRNWRNVAATNVALIGARMNSNARSTCIENNAGAGNKIRQAVVAAVTKQGDTVDIGREVSH